MESGQDCLSLASSIELKDALVDTKWFQPGETHSSKPTGDKWSKRIKEAEAITLEDYVVSRLPFYARWYEAYKVRSLNQRLEKFELDEIESFVKQKLHKITDVIADQGRKLRLFSSIAIKPNNVEITYRSSELKRKYGATLICWLDDVAAGLDQPSSEIIEKLLHGFTQFKAVDPLANWTKQGNEFYCRMLGRINTFASEMATMVNYSFIIEPGTITPHLSDYVAEFRHLETFFERNPLTPEESNQSAFNRNCNKVRNKLTECADISRVILQCDKSRDSSFSEKFVTGSSSCFLNAEDSIHENSNDFIHASYVRGGPLLNTFILTQAPLLSTIADFWQMVWQERSHYIVMLCKAVDVSTLGLLDGALPNVCPYYWPR
ncbi:unnamed protein product [Thelazia callipaeda]|uniref:Tyrosine-protein phosphatase domain-containing protein n=1 Tax=Thelazia callipaeda TaxID=103827 RepID=A0A0N5CSK9_THECL|nr:unnamed protein product [Thelazia callipaeda]